MTIISLGGKIEVGDVPNAFLNVAIDANIYMEFLEGYKTDPNRVCKLNKGLYGLKQAAILWHTDIDCYLTQTLGFQRLPDDRCIYTLKTKEDIFIIIILYVDNIAIGTNSPEEMDRIFGTLSARFMIKQLGPLENTHYLGMQVTMSQNNSTVLMTQPHTISKLLTKFNLSQTTPTKSPYNLKIKLMADGEPFNNITLYRSLIGALF